MIQPGQPFVDDRERIQQLLNDGEVQFAPGDFYVGGPLVIPVGHSVYGEGIGRNGMGRTTIHMLPTSPGETRSAVVTLQDGAKLKWITTESRQAICNGITCEGVMGTTVEECEVWTALGHTYGVWAHNSKNGVFLACHANGNCMAYDKNSEQEGIEVFGCEDWLVEACISENIGRGGFNCYVEEGASNKNVTFHSNMAQRCAYNFCAHITAHPKDMIISGKWTDNVSSMPWVSDLNVVSGPKGRLSLTFKGNNFKTAHINTQGPQTAIEIL